MKHKTKKSRAYRWGCLGLLFGFLALSQIVSSCVSFSMSDRKFEKRFAEKEPRPQSYQATVDGYTMRYVYLDAQKEGTLIFVHGSPGGWDAFVDYFEDSTLYQQANLMAPDRPGFGQSSYGQPIASLPRQADLLAALIEKTPAPRILIGHSMGGPVIARMAMDHPELVDGLLFLAASIAPELEPDDDWYRKPMRWPVISALVPKVFRISNEELIFLEDELEDMLPLWSNIQLPTIVMQGEKDNLVHPGNADFAEKMLTNAPKEIIRLPEQNHFLPWNMFDMIVEKALSLLREARKNPN